MKFLIPALIFCLPLWGQLPSESLLIINSSSPEALRVAEHYVQLRLIPEERILRLSPPESFFRDAETGAPQWRSSFEAVRTHLLQPVLERLETLADPFPTALILSPDWPTLLRLPDGTPVSVAAFLATQGEMPEGETIRNGTARGPWFADPAQLGETRRLPRFPHPGPMPAPYHPTMMLGVFYEPLTPDVLISALDRATAADFRRPAGTVAIITNTDVRTRARLPQFETAAARLQARGIPVHLASRQEPLPENIIGAMEGAANVPVSRYRGRLQPGAFAEHLTSFAATFHTAEQTKMTEWIAAGAAGTIGTVYEPFAIWTKFPLAQIFERYLLGHTLLEAIHQSVGSPFQTLAIGDPLCRPWGAPLPDLTLTPSREGNIVTLEASGVRMGPATDLHLFHNGRRVAGNGPRWEVELSEPGEQHFILHARRNWAPPEVGSTQITLDGD